MRRKGHILTAAPIIVTLDELEVAEASLKGFSLLKLIRDYAYSDPERLTSMHDFLAKAPNYRDKIYANQRLASIAMKLVERAKVLF